MTRLILLSALALSLAACATPRESCLRTATKDLIVIDRLIAETQATLARGYALEREPYTRTQVDLCLGSGRYGYGRGGIGWNYCATPTTRYRDRPVAIDRAAEERKLRELRQTRTRLAPEVEQRAAQCSARYPAS